MTANGPERRPRHWWYTVKCANCGEVMRVTHPSSEWLPGAVSGDLACSACRRVALVIVSSDGATADAWLRDALADAGLDGRAAGRGETP